MPASIPVSAPGAAHPGQRAPVSGWLGNLAGGASAALIALPQSLAMGILAFLPLGTAQVHLGVVAGLTAAIASGVATALFGTSPMQISSPRASTAVILASLITSLSLHPVLTSVGSGDEAAIITLAFIAVLLGGAMQAAFAWFKLGRALKFIPYPVLAGFMYGIALLILVVQARPLMGLPPDVSFADPLRLFEGIRPGAMGVALVTVFATLIMPRYTTKIPATFGGLVAGVVAYWIFHRIGGEGVAGQTLGNLSNGLLPQAFFPGLLAIDWAALGPEIWLTIAGTAFLMAILGSVDTLVGIAAIDTATGRNHDGDQVLLTQGISNMASGCAGGIFTGASPIMALTSMTAGGRTMGLLAFYALTLLIVMLAAGTVLTLVPVAALAGILVTVAIGLLRDWTRELNVELHRDVMHQKENAINMGIAALVATTLLLANIVAAVLIGVIAATILLAVRLSTSIIFRVSDRRTRASMKVRSPDNMAFLKTHGQQIAIVELTGYVFFGTADRIRAEADRLSTDCKVLILDFRRVYAVEASGGRVLKIIGKTLAEKGVQVVLAHVRTDESVGRHMNEMGVAQEINIVRWYTDLDRALEWAEDSMLAQSNVVERDAVPLASSVLCIGLSAEEIAQLEPLLERHELKKGDQIFGEGDSGDRLYLVAKGLVSIKVKVPGTNRARRLATFGPGVVFAEMALIEGRPRSADAYAKAETILLSLPAASFEQMKRDRPELALKILGNVARQLSSSLRAASEELRTSY